MALRIGIMGFGRIGRNVFRILYPRDDMEIAAIVDIADPKALEYLLKFDTVHGRFSEPVVRGDAMYVKGRQIAMLQRKAPGEVDWRALGADIVIEATGQYRTREFLQAHLDGGAHRVILTVPPRKDSDVPVVILGVNDAALTAETRMVSLGSCTSNALAPVCKVLDDAFGIERGFMTTVHAYTNDQRLADVPHSELRRSRAAAENIIPTTTWSPLAVERVLPQLAGRLDGMALNVPVSDGSNVDLVTLMKRPVRVDEVNEVMRSAAATRFRGIIEYTDQPIVSSDVIGSPHSGTFDSLSTQVLGGNLLKTITWYDNGWGYATRVVDLALRMARFDAGAGSKAAS